MRTRGTIVIRGIVQGVGFRPFVFSLAEKFGITGSVKNLGSEVEIHAFGPRFEEFLQEVSTGTPLSVIDSVAVHDLAGPAPPAFRILDSTEGGRSGFIPSDVAICPACVGDIFRNGSRYEGYWATSCVDCGPRYSIIRAIPYDRGRTSMGVFPTCAACQREYTDPASRRHHAQTIACDTCGPSLRLLGKDGNPVSGEPVREAARLLDEGHIIAIRGLGGFHIACIEESSCTLKQRLGRTEQPFAVMIRKDHVADIVDPNNWDWDALTSRMRPIVVIPKKDPSAHAGISNLHNLGVMLPYTGLHHLLFARLQYPLLIMTSANVPGYPMITDTARAVRELQGKADYFLVHDREIVNRCDDSVVRDGYIIRLSRGLAPKRMKIDLGPRCILGVGPELNANATIYRDGFSITSPHIGHVRNPPTLAYLKETIENLSSLLGARFEIIAHDLHPAFLSTRYARELALECGAMLVPVQHHRAHIAATTLEPCVGIAIDGVGYGDDGKVWGGEIFAGQAPHLSRVAHLEEVPMPGGDLATQFPERMLYGILRNTDCLELLAQRGWNPTQLGVLERQVERRVNVAWTSSTGRVLDATAALLGICRERTYDGEPAMRLESVAMGGHPQDWDIIISRQNGSRILSTRSLLNEALARYRALDGAGSPEYGKGVADIAASLQHNLSRGIAQLAIEAAGEQDFPRIAVSGGVAYNHQIRTTIENAVRRAALSCVLNREFPLGDGCISFGQCVTAGLLAKDR
ncbi:MAG: carbamoyltransferase HypF [Methanomicrobiales archaeon]|nr:carbamoyltransferase HypF [Methanomicrobiales archaeon]